MVRRRDGRGGRLERLSHDAPVVLQQRVGERVLLAAGDHGAEGLVQVERARRLPGAFPVAGLDKRGRNQTEAV